VVVTGTRPRPPNAGKGRPKGSANKTTVLAKEAIEDAFRHLQAHKDKNLRTWAEANTDDFYKLLFPKLLPVQLQAGDGQQSGTLVIAWQTNPDAS
jgi:hypothetical protein